MLSLRSRADTVRVPWPAAVMALALMQLLWGGTLVLFASGPRGSSDGRLHGAPDRAAARAGAPSFRRDVMPVLKGSCAFARCHAGDSPQAGWRVSDAGATYRSLLEAPATEKPSMVRVKAGSPTDSVLWLKVANKHREAGIPGSRMPPGSPLTGDQLRTIEDWVRRGAAP